MEKASIIDIQGVQWAIKDQEATANINAIKEQLTPKRINDITLNLKEGYYADVAEIQNIIKYGHIYTGNIFINNIKGTSIGTLQSVQVAITPFNVIGDVNSICIDAEKGLIVRARIESNNIFCIYESLNVEQGNNKIRGQVVWIEE